MEAIKNIIFDLGGVVLNIDFDRAAQAFREAGLDDFEQLYSRAVQSELFDRLERGKISPEDFRKELRKLAGIQLSDSLIDRCWNALLLDFPPARLQLLQELREHYRLFLLSNTNIIHAEAYNNELRQRHNINGLEALFDRVYYSHDIGLRKPDAESFLYVLNDQKIKAEETLFIDDSLPNIEAAGALGMQTLYIDLEAGADICDFFENGWLTDK
jgi:putative hydrolase of the HAD superfamily